MKRYLINLRLKRYLTLSFLIIEIALMVLTFLKFDLGSLRIYLIFFLAFLIAVTLVFLIIFMSLRLKHFLYNKEVISVYCGIHEYLLFLDNEIITGIHSNFKAKSVVLDKKINEDFILCHIKSNKIYLRINYELQKNVLYKNLKKH